MARRTRQTVEAEPQTQANEVNRQDLIDALTKVNPGLAKKELIEQSTHFIFDDDKIWTYNDQITIMHKFNTGLTGAVKAEKFFKLLDKIPDETIQISGTEKGKIKLSGKKIKATINIDPDIKLQPIQVPGINSKQWEELPKNFSDAIAFAAFSASRNMARPELTCIWITDGQAVSCDSYRGTKYQLDSKMEQDFLLPATAAVELAKYTPYKIIIDGGWLHFINNEKTSFSCRTYYDEEYPAMIWKFFEIEGQKIVLPDDFLDAIGRAEIMLTADFDLDRFVLLTMEANTLTCKGEGIYGEFEETTDIDYSGEKIEIKVHPVLLSQILKHIQVMVVGERLLFHGDKFQHGVCLSC